LLLHGTPSAVHVSAAAAAAAAAGCDANVACVTRRAATDRDGLLSQTRQHTHTHTRGGSCSDVGACVLIHGVLDRVRTATHVENGSYRAIDDSGTAPGSAEIRQI